MYKVNQRSHRYDKLLGAVAGVCLVAAFGLLAAYYMGQGKQSSTIKNKPGSVTPYEPNAASRTMNVFKPAFSVKLPYGWQEKEVKGGVNPPMYLFTAGAGKTQQLEIFLDSIPSVYAFNKVIVVNAQGSGLARSPVSDNCSTFTDNQATDRTTGYAVSKWRAVQFVCDMGNNTRAVVGTASVEAQNYVTVTGASGATHKLLLVYTDNAISPDYTTLYDIVSSLRFK